MTNSGSGSWLERAVERLSRSRLAPVGRLIRNLAFGWNEVGGTLDGGLPPMGMGIPPKPEDEKPTSA